VGWCADHGLPHSALLGWDPQDRAKLVAHLLEAGERCQMCGTAAWEWEADQYAYTPMATMCTGCHLKDSAAEENLPAGTTMTLVPRAVAERRSAAAQWAADVRS